MNKQWHEYWEDRNNYPSIGRYQNGFTVMFSEYGRGITLVAGAGHRVGTNTYSRNMRVFRPLAGKNNEIIGMKPSEQELKKLQEGT